MVLYLLSIQTVTRNELSLKKGIGWASGFGEDNCPDRVLTLYLMDPTTEVATTQPSYVSPNC